MKNSYRRLFWIGFTIYVLSVVISGLGDHVFTSWSQNAVFRLLFQDLLFRMPLLATVGMVLYCISLIETGGLSRFLSSGFLGILFTIAGLLLSSMIFVGIQTLADGAVDWLTFAAIFLFASAFWLTVLMGMNHLLTGIGKPKSGAGTRPPLTTQGGSHAEQEVS